MIKKITSCMLLFALMIVSLESFSMAFSSNNIDTKNEVLVEQVGPDTVVAASHPLKFLSGTDEKGSSVSWIGLVVLLVVLILWRVFGKKSGGGGPYT